MCEVGCKYTSFMNSGSAIGIIGSYGHEANLVGRIINLWDVDKYGNVYWLEFHPTHVEIKVSSR